MVPWARPLITQQIRDSHCYFLEELPPGNAELLEDNWKQLEQAGAQPPDFCHCCSDAILLHAVGIHGHTWKKTN